METDIDSADSLRNLHQSIQHLVKLHIQECGKRQWCSDAYMDEMQSDDIMRQLDQPMRKTRYALTNLLPYI